MNKLIIGIVVIAVVVVGGLLYFNLGDNGTGVENTESSLPTPPAEPSEDQLPVAEPTAQTPPPAGGSMPVKPAATPPPVAPVVTPPPAPTPTPTPPTPTPPPVSQPTTHQVSIQGFAFSQSSITVKKGDTVVWTNKDSAPHTVTEDSPTGGGPASQTLNNGGAYSFTFTSTGTFSYHCAFHPGMTGKVVVTQ